MVWTAPTPRTTGELITASIWNTDIVDNLNLLKTSIANDGKLNATGGTIRRPAILNYTEQYLPVSIIGGVVTLDLTYCEFAVTMNANVGTLAFTNIPPGVTSGGLVTTATVLLIGDGTQRSFVWTGVRFSGNQPPVPTPVLNGVDVITMRTYDGITWLGAAFGQRM